MNELIELGYMIKGVNDCLQGYNGFQYPTKGEVVAPDWNPEPKCEGGIFGCTEGAWGYDFTDHSRFLVLSFEKGTEVKIENNKIKVPKAKVLKVFNDLQKAIDFFEKKSGLIYCGHESTQTAGDKAMQVAGPWSTQTAGDESTQAAGYGSTQAAGHKATQTACFRSTQTAGDESTQTAGSWSTQTAGHKATQTAGDESTQTARYRSTQTAGDGSTQTAWQDATQTAGTGSTQTAGDGSTSVLHGSLGFCKHRGKVLQVVWCAGNCYTELRIWDGKKYKLEVIDNNLTIEECTND